MSKPSETDSSVSGAANNDAGEATDSGQSTEDLNNDASLPSVSDFSGFVLSLAANAMMNLRDEPSDGRIASDRNIDLKAAAQYIDILVMLSSKTKGNLSDEEQKLLDSLLYDLRMSYVEVAGQS